VAKSSLRGRPPIFRKTDRPAPEIADAQTSERQNVETARRPRIKATFYLEPDDVVAIDVMQTDEFRRTGKKPERSEIVSRAIQRLFGGRPG
jgi:hypothetical protein